jgi:hypothetical protein
MLQRRVAQPEPVNPAAEAVGSFTINEPIP